MADEVSAEPRHVAVVETDRCESGTEVDEGALDLLPEVLGYDRAVRPSAVLTGYEDKPFRR
jgi:hypothetical protein